ncbi:hypothetical protein D3C86_2048650 [compost metagenome]
MTISVASVPRNIASVVSSFNMKSIVSITDTYTKPRIAPSTMDFCKPNLPIPASMIFGFISAKTGALSVFLIAA